MYVVLVLVRVAKILLVSSVYTCTSVYTVILDLVVEVWET